MAFKVIAGNEGVICLRSRKTSEKIPNNKSILEDLKKEIVTTIIKDYIALRRKLKLQNQIDASIVQKTVFGDLK